MNGCWVFRVGVKSWCVGIMFVELKMAVEEGRGGNRVVIGVCLMRFGVMVLGVGGIDVFVFEFDMIGSALMVSADVEFSADAFDICKGVIMIGKYVLVRDI